MDANLLKSLLAEAIEKLERYAQRQGPRRMKGRELGQGSRTNPNPNSHYPAVQSVIDRANHVLNKK